MPLRLVEAACVRTDISLIPKIVIDHYLLLYKIVTKVINI
jgi:hypothetical protein